MPFAQLVVGPPGAGKSTYCNGMQQFMGAIGRKASVVNLDPANDLTSYEPAIDVRDLVRLEDIMANDELGPNGSVLYALEEVEHNMDWLQDRLRKLGEDYVLFDCPGQVELFTHHDSLRKMFFAIQKMGYRVSKWQELYRRTLLILAACRSQSHRFICPDTPLTVHCDTPLILENDAADGPDASQCADQDRQSTQIS